MVEEFIVGSQFSLTANVLCENGIIANNKAQQNGGGMFVDHCLISVSNQTILRNNEAQQNGGMIYVQGSSQSNTFHNVRIENNKAMNGKLKKNKRIKRIN